MTFATALQALTNTDFATAVRESDWMFPTVETVHVLALSLVVGSISMMDLRLLQVTSKNRSVTELAAEVLPWTWGSFALAAMAGFLLFASRAPSYWANLSFRLKALCMLLAGLNMLYFHFVTWRTVHDWDRAPRTPTSVKVAGALSLLFWIGVVAAGRVVGFTMR